MRKLIAVLAVLAVFGLGTAQAALVMSGSTYASPTHYQSYSSTAPSPFSTAGGGLFTDTLGGGGGGRYWTGTGEYFYLEDCEDGSVNTTGLTSSDPVSGPGGGYDSLNASVGSFSFVVNEYFDNSFGSTSTAEDTFFGFYDAGGIAKIEGSIGGTGDFSGEYDHIQYGYLIETEPIAEPAGLGLMGVALLGLRKRRS